MTTTRIINPANNSIWHAIAEPVAGKTAKGSPVSAVLVRQEPFGFDGTYPAWCPYAVALTTPDRTVFTPTFDTRDAADGFIRDKVLAN